MPPLARRNLFHDKVRLAVTLTGIVFAVVLVVIELGLFVGFTVSTSTLIDNAEADLWVTSKQVPYIELGVRFSERKLYQVRSVTGVDRAEKLIVGWSSWKRPDGRQESVQIVGLSPNVPMGLPWNLVPGTTVDDLRRPDGVIVDELSKAKLGVSRVGEVFELNGHRARVVGFTRGIKTFTTMPYVFTTFKRGLDYARVPADQTIYVLVKVRPGVEVEQVRRVILGRVQDVDVLTGARFARMTQSYWMFTTGAGIALLMAAVLGLIVGFVIVAQTIYATTMDHLREFGTLKALGAPNSYVYWVIVKQAALSAVIGYALGMAVSYALVTASKDSGASILLPWTLAVAMFFLTLLMCVGAALVSIHKVTRLDPAMVFKS
jgi:putative ABC transport system permease protein